MGSAFYQLCPRYSGILTPNAPTAMGNLYLLPFNPIALRTAKTLFKTQQSFGCSECNRVKGYSKLNLVLFSMRDLIKNAVEGCLLLACALTQSVPCSTKVRLSSTPSQKFRDKIRAVSPKI